MTTTSLRFDSAIKALYTAFHANSLNPEDCKQCAVGNILNGQDFWKHFTNLHGSVKLSYVGLVHQNLGRRFNGYSPLELLQIEAAFLKGCHYKGIGLGYCHKPKGSKNDAILFLGLCAVVEVLCKLDQIKNMMDCTTLFAYKRESASLSLI